MGKRMDDWLCNMGTETPSRGATTACRYRSTSARAPRERRRVEEGQERACEARAARGAPAAWIDEVPIRCEACGEEVRRIPEVGDVWLDAGIVPFSTLGWRNES